MRVELNLPIERKWFDMIARGERMAAQIVAAVNEKEDSQ